MHLHTLTQESPDWAYWAKEIASIDWAAGAYLAKKMTTTKFLPWERVIVAEDGDRLVGCCALLAKDIVENTSATPFISTVYVVPDYRGHHISQQLVIRAEREAEAAHFKSTFIATEHMGLYEKLGYSEFTREPDIFGREMRLLARSFPKDDPFGHSPNG